MTSADFFHYISTFVPIVHYTLYSFMNVKIKLINAKKMHLDFIQYAKELDELVKNIIDEEFEEKKRKFIEEKETLNLAYEERRKTYVREAEKLREQKIIMENEQQEYKACLEVVGTSLALANQRAKVKTRKAADLDPTPVDSANQTLTTAPAVIIPEYIHELVSDVLTRDFDEVINCFKNELKAEYTFVGHKHKLRFISPITDKPIIVFAHNIHGAQIEKIHPGWWHNIRKAFVHAGMLER
jgi:hypothetical protein